MGNSMTSTNSIAPQIENPSTTRNDQLYAGLPIGTNVPDENDRRIEALIAKEVDRKFGTMLERLDKLDLKVTALLQQQCVKDWYSLDEVAKRVGREEYTVREWCRHGRIHAKKKGSGRGKHRSWVVSHEELERIQRDGLLPVHRQ